MWTGKNRDRRARRHAPHARGTRIDERRSLESLVAAAAAAAVAVLPLPAMAIEKDWKSTVGSGNWSTAANWLQGTIPASFDDAVIVHNDAINRVITYDYAGIAVTLNSLTH